MFTSWMGAPDTRRSRVVRMSAREAGRRRGRHGRCAAGNENEGEVIRARGGCQVQSLRAAAKPRSVGTGCPASMMRTPPLLCKEGGGGR